MCPQGYSWRVQVPPCVRPVTAASNSWKATARCSCIHSRFTSLRWCTVKLHWSVFTTGQRMPTMKFWRIVTYLKLLKFGFREIKAIFFWDFDKAQLQYAGVSDERWEAIISVNLRHACSLYTGQSQGSRNGTDISVYMAVKHIVNGFISSDHVWTLKVVKQIFLSGVSGLRPSRLLQ